jgi:hypothetical protein
MRIHRLLVAAAFAASVPLVSFAQRGDLTHDEPAVESAAVDFGVLPFPAGTPLGPPPCATGIPPSPAIGGPADPCAYKLHHLTPEEVTVVAGGEVTFQIHGGGHGLMIYEVSKDTTRDELGQFLCAGSDPEHIADPALHVCNLLAANSDALHLIADGHGDIVITAEPGSSLPTAVHPDNRVWSPPGRLMSAGAQQFLNGGTIPAGEASNGQLITYRFLKTGRYLVTCMNRVHFLNDWMFGFVNVTGQ